MGVSSKVIYPELSYKILGVAFQTFNELGYGVSEKYYQRVFAKKMEEAGVPFGREQMINLHYKNQSIGRYFLDFIADGKIVIELKVKPKLGYTHIKQVMDYLKITDCKLAILIYFTRDGVKYRRVLNTAETT